MKAFLRFATMEEWRTLSALDTSAFTQPWQPQTWQTTLRDPKNIVLVAIENGLISAFGVAYTVGEEGEIATLAVDEAMRGRGLGEAILRALLIECVGRGGRRIFLEVREGNASAQRLYEKLGFQTVGRRTNYYADGETALVMKWEIENQN